MIVGTALAILGFIATAFAAGVTPAIAPWTSVAVPLVPIIIIVTATLRRPDALPSGLVFLGGLWVDAITHGPLGYWAFLYLMARFLTLLTPPSMQGRTFGRALTVFGVICLVGLIGYVIVGAYRLALPVSADSIRAVLWISAVTVILDWSLPRPAFVRSFTHASARVRSGGADVSA